MSEWQPIETAPKDETLVLLLGLVYGKGPDRWIALASFRNNAWREEEDALEDYPLMFPTHWMPLQKPPVAKLAAQSQATLEGE